MMNKHPYIFKSLVIALLIIIYPLCFFIPALAATSSGLDNATLDFYDENNILYYDPCGGSSGGSGSGSTADTVTGDSNEAKVWNWFAEKGLSAEVIAGIMGNMQQEHGFKTDFDNRDASPYGIVQWTEGRRSSVLSQIPIDATEDEALAIQLNFLYNEGQFQRFLNNISQVDNTSGENGVKSYSDLFLVTVEGAHSDSPTGAQGTSNALVDSHAQALGDTTGHQYWQEAEIRRNYATHFYQKYSGTTPTTDTDTDDSSTTNTSSTRSGACSGRSSFSHSAYTGEGVPQYFQCDSRWGNLMYGSGGIHGTSGSSICDSGCGPTSFAMMATVLLGEEILPDETADIAGKDGMHVPDEGSSWEITFDLAKEYNLDTDDFSTTPANCKNAINKALDEGWMIHTSGAGSKPFTTGGHYIGITGRNASGQWYIANSAAHDNANGYYDPDTVINAGMNCNNLKGIKRK